MAGIIKEKKPGSITIGETARRIFSNEVSILAAVLVAMVIGFAGSTGGRSASGVNAYNILAQSAVRGVASAGQGLVILTAGIDLSVGGIALLCNVIGASLMTGTEGFPAGVIAIMLLVGLAVGTVNGVLISRIGIPPLIVTLAMWQILKGAALWITGGALISNLPKAFGIIGQGAIGPMPMIALVFIGVAAVVYLILYHTAFGRSIYAVGGNPVSAWLSGIKTKDILLIVYMISGFCAALTGVMLGSRMMVGSMNVGTGLELDSIAAVCIGGVSLAGGRGSLIGVILGVFIIGIINNGMNLMKLSAAFQYIVKGVIIIAAVAADYLRKR